MTPHTIISHYNHLNGKSVTIETLRKLHGDIQKYLEANGSGPGTKELNEIRTRLAKGLKTMAKNKATSIKKLIIDHPIEIEVDKKPIDKKRQKTIDKKPVKRVPRKVKKVKSLVSVDESMLCGLECIQDDQEYADQSTGLGELNNTAYKVITDRILDLIKDNGLVWRKPWDETSNFKINAAQNYVTKHVYRGGNGYLNWLWRFGVIVTKQDGKKVKVHYKTPYFFTFNQIKKLGGSVKAGEKGWPVIYFKWLYKSLKKNKLVDVREATDSEGKIKPGYGQIPGVFYYVAFNLDQTEGLNVKLEKAKPRTEAQKIESAEAIVNGYPNPPKIEIGGDQAFYRRSEDLIRMPKIQFFKKEQFYYSTLFHEMIHSTGHESRVYREREQGRRFGDKKYAFEELIAELGAAFLCGESGILYFTMNNSAAYVKNWSTALIEELKEDPKFYFKAAGQSQKAADYILGKSEAKQSKKATSNTKERKPVKRSAKPETSNLKPVTNLGFVSADQMPDRPADTFQLPGEVGKLLGNLQAYKLEIMISGETHSSKSELAKQVANAFIKAGHDVAYVDWEHGGLQSKDTQDGIRRNIEAGSKNKLLVNGEVPRTLEAVKDLAKHFKVIVLDSGTKIKGQITNAWVDELREEYPHTIWVITMQQNEKGGTRGGSSAEFDAPIVIKTYRDDINDYRKNYAVVEKNRGNGTGTRYNIASKKIVKQLQKEAA